MPDPGPAGPPGPLVPPVPHIAKSGHLTAGTTASTPAPSSGFQVFGQTWQLALAIVVACIAVVVLAVIATRRRHLAHA